MCVPCRVTIQWTTQTPAWKSLKDELPVLLLGWWSKWQRWVRPPVEGMGRRGEGVRARLPRTGCGLCARKLTLSHHRAWTRGKGSLQEVNFLLTVRPKEQKAEPQRGHHSWGTSAWRWQNWEGEAALRGAGGVHGRKTQLKLLPGQHPVTTTPQLRILFLLCLHFLGPIPGRVRNLNTQDLASLMLASSLQLAQRSLNFKW